MVKASGNDGENTQEYDTDLPVAIPNGTIFAYNLDESKTPGGLKVRFKVRVVTGAEADRHEARLAEAIKEALIWTQRHLMDT